MLGVENDDYSIGLCYVTHEMHRGFFQLFSFSMQITLVGPLCLYILMRTEIKNRRIYARFKKWYLEYIELDKRHQPLWKVCCELLLAVILTRQILSTWFDHFYREGLPWPVSKFVRICDG